MTINYLPLDKIITVVATEIEDFITNIVDYTGLTLNININCVTSSTELVINTTDILDNTKNVYIENNILYIKPESIGGASSFIDGIYDLSIKFNKESGYIKISNCYFVDVTFKCKVASLLQNIIAENKAGNTEKVSTIVHLLHYSLVNGSNCGCNCQELCDVFYGLSDLLLNIDTKLVNDCGC